MNIRSIILIVSLLAALVLLVMPLPDGLTESGRRALVIGVAMAALWMTEALPLAVTAMIPLALFPLLGIADIGVVSEAYANPLVILFMGGFMLAAAMQRWQLHRRVALIALRWAGPRQDLQVLAIMSATAFLSMWISNTATTMVMMPIGLAMLSGSGADDDGRSGTGPDAPRNMADLDAGGSGSALMLGIAFAATIGGMGSLIGTPPNALLAGFVEKTYGVSIGFGQWMLVGVPIVAVLLPTAWLVLTRIAFALPAGADATVANDPNFELPALSTAQRTVGAVLVLVALGWIMRPFIAAWLGLPGLSDAGIAIAGVIALFMLPDGLPGGSRLMTWDDVKPIRWDVLILFGGGLALADAIRGTGLAEWIAGGATYFEAMPATVLILLMMIIIVYLGELASNTAMAAIFLPIAAAAAAGLGTEPLALLVPVALAASLGFMLPVATPPNAIVYGSGAVRPGDMLRAGAILDILSIGVVFLLSMVLLPMVFGALS